MLNERGTSLYYESVMLEDGLKMHVKKYRTCNTYSDLKLLSNRFQEMASRAAKLNNEYPVDHNATIFNNQCLGS